MNDKNITLFFCNIAQNLSGQRFIQSYDFTFSGGLTFRDTGRGHASS